MHDKLRTTIVTTLAALSFPALAAAQSTGTSQGSAAQPSQGNTSRSSAQTTSRGSSSQGNTSQGSQGNTSQGSQGNTSQGSSGSGQGSNGSPSGMQQQGSSSGSMSGQHSMSGQSSSAASSTSGNMQMGNTQAGIDRNQIQRVFGTDATVIDLKSLGANEIRNVQQTLKDRGLYQGQVDGVMGPQTRAALSAMLSQQYALNQRLINQGQLTGQLASSIGVDTSGVTPVNGVDMGMPSNQRQPAQPGAGQRQGQPERTRPSSPNAPQLPMEDDSDPRNPAPEPIP
jgi:hypothetical protein